MGTYHNGPFCGGSNIYLNLITCEDDIFIPPILKSYLLHWYHIYLLLPVIDRMEAMICQHLYWPRIREAIKKEVTDCDTLQRTKRSKIKYDKLPSKEDEETSWNKIYVDIIGPYVNKKKGTEIKFKSKRCYQDIYCNRMVQNNAILIVNLVETT